MTTVLTFGHGTAGQEELLALLSGAGVELVVDVRRFPGSRRHPHVKREVLSESLPEAGIDYRWEPRLGGRRSTGADSPDTWWRVKAFRAYAAHMRTAEFAEGFAALEEAVAAGTTAIMCSETLWWRCHRRMVADFATLACGWSVRHLLHDGSLSDHPPAEGARVEDRLLFYDRPA